MANKQLRNELNRFSNKTEQPLRLYSGALGIYIGGKQYVDVPNRPGFVYVRLSSNISELIQAHNQVVSPVYDLPVLLTKTKTYYEVFGRDVEQWANYDTSSSSFLPKHGFQHEFDPDNGGGGDLVFVHGEQFYPLMGFPSGTDGAGNILIAPYRYYANNDWHYAGNTGTPDLLQYKPTGSANAVLLLVGLTVNTGNPFVKIGTEFAESITGASALTDYVPTSLTVSNEIPGTIVRLVTGTDVITWANIYDARQYMGILQASANSFIALTDVPASYIGQADKLVTVKTDESGLEFRVNTGSFGGGGGGGTIGIYGRDEGASLGTGTTLNVVGADISLSISGTTLTLSHTDPTGTPHSFLDLTDTPDSYSGQGGKYAAVNAGATALEFVNAPSASNLLIYDDSAFKVTGTAISFDSNLSVAVTGSVAFVSTTAPVSAINVNGTLAQDEGTPLGTGTTFNFVGGGVVATISGSVVQVFVTGSSGGGYVSGELDYKQITGTVTVTSTTEATANIIITGSSISYDGSTSIIIEFASSNINPDKTAAGRSLFLWLYEDNASIGRIALVVSQVATIDYTVPVTITRRLMPPSGTHQYSIRGSVGSAGWTGAIAAGGGRLGETMPAFIRITRA